MGRDEWDGNEKQKQPPEVFYTKSFSWKFCNIHRNTPVSDSYLDSLFFLLKTESNLGVFLLILQNF